MNSEFARFKQLKKRKENQKKVLKNMDVWLYTRVSSGKQKDNYSLEVQKEEAYKFADEKGYTITEVFGNTNESASGDFTRQEFTNLINKVKKSKQKPFGILVFVVNRFSRTGGHAIGIADLMNQLGVHIIEVKSGIDTSTEQGQYYIFNKLLEAKKQNLDRLEVTLPGMKKFLAKGNHLGTAPLGYDHFGPKVSDPDKIAARQKIVINSDGEKLRLAWEWKVNGMPDFQILQKLSDLGLTISKQKLSSIWRTPFYCAVSINSLLDDEVDGNWQPLVSKETFLKVNSIISKNHQGYSIEKESTARPLTGHLLCNCGQKMTGYENKKKKLHYYKCQKCKGETINANTSIIKFPDKKGAHQLFVELLDSYYLKPEFIGPFELQIKKMLSNYSESSKQESKAISNRINELKDNLTDMKKRAALGKLPMDLYEEFRPQLEKDIAELEGKIVLPQKDVSNLDKHLCKAIDFSQNISKYWLSVDVRLKKGIQNLVFPMGLKIDCKNRRYLTSDMNKLFQAKSDFMKVSVDKKQKPLGISTEGSCLVAGAGLEPTTFGL